MHRLPSRKLETTLLSYSRQQLPRPARYSTPSKVLRAQPALATAPSTPDFIPVDVPDEIKARSFDAMGRFLKGPQAFTLIHPPLPADRASENNPLFFPSSPAQESLAVVEACLHDSYDVPRAKVVFDQLRVKGGVEISNRVYNLVLSSYLLTATRATKPRDRAIWLSHTVTMFREICEGTAGLKPSASTFAIMIAAWYRFGPESQTHVEGIRLDDPKELLQGIVKHGLQLSYIFADRVFHDSEEVDAVLSIMSRTAIEEGLSDLVLELGQVEALGKQTNDPLGDVPDVKPVENTKLVDEDGEKKEYTEVPFNLSTLRKHLGKVRLARRLLIDDAMARQKILEESVYDVAVERLSRFTQQMTDLGLDQSALKQRELQTWMWQWHQQLRVALKEAIADVQEIEREEALNPRRRRPLILAPFLSLLSTDKLSLVTILELMRIQGTGGISGGMKTARALVSIGKAVEIEHKAEICRKNNITLPTHAMRPGDTSYFTNLSYTDLHQRRLAARQFMEDEEEWTADWTQALRVRVGSFLVDKLIEVATVQRTATDKQGNVITEEQPALFHTYEYMRGQKLGVLRLNPAVAERLGRDGLAETLHPRHLPMLVKPRQWTDYNQGGYLYMKSQAMRFKDSQEQLTYLRHAAQEGNAELVFAGLDVLGSTPWQINRQIFDVVLEVWNSGRRLGKLPPSVFEEEEPVKPANYDVDPLAKSVYITRHREFMHKKANNHSNRCNVNYKIEIARTFLGDAFYLPHNVDFRGRAYPIPPHLNHIGDDLSRGLLKFAEKRPLGERGLQWLKIHLANLYGYDKGSFEERENFVMQNLSEVYDSALRPLTGNAWWQKADDPWQCLATCMELHAALESDDPLQFQSNLPVHQDGTCNGLQHYAALGGDAAGARQVNLDVTDRPSDVYTYVAEMVERRLEEEAAKGSILAETLKGKIARKVVKQTVMTTVYGVTYIGARDQIHRQLRDRGDIPAEDCWELSAYLAKMVLNCIGTLFSGANQIQKWLNICARIITKSVPGDRVADALLYDKARKTRKKQSQVVRRLKKEQMSSVIWTTPLGLPIVQPYRSLVRKQVMTSLQTIYISDPTVASTVNSLKQSSAFPPNFIHSLDATHMMLTALEMRTHNLTFASVHDSYWTHASSIDEMSEIIRETFIALHNRDILSRLREEFLERYKDHKVPADLIIGNKSMATIGLKALTESLMQAQTSKTPEVTEKVVEALEQVVKSLPDASSNGEESMDEAEEEEGEGDVEEVEAAEKAAAERLFETEIIPDLHRKVASGEVKNLKFASKEVLEKALENRFVDLVDLLPEVPAKGDFDVSKIKGSQYFFS